MNFYGVRFTPLFEYSLDGYTTSAPFPEDWALKWADYFDGSALDRNMWEVAVGRGCELKECGYGNGELQSYEEANVWVEGGNMVIESRKETVQGYPVGDCGDRSCSPFAGADYTSGKVVSIPPNYEVLYGRLRARIKFGEGKGLWPAFWMLPSPANDADFYTQDGVYGKWPQSGELDIVEVANDMVGSAWGLHWGTEVDHESQDCWYTGDHYYGREWLIYELQWAPWGEMRWYLDGLEVCRVPETPGMQPWWAPGGTGQAPFDQPFYVNFNVAVGGWWPGDPDDSILPQQTLIDWVEYYEWPTNRRLPEGWQKRNE
jgi:beta-glucanase (GH16 family)